MHNFLHNYMYNQLAQLTKFGSVKRSSEVCVIVEHFSGC